MSVRLLSPDSVGVSLAWLIESHLYLSILGSMFGIRTCWTRADYSLMICPTMSHHQLTPISHIDSFMRVNSNAHQRMYQSIFLSIHFSLMGLIPSSTRVGIAFERNQTFQYVCVAPISFIPAHSWLSVSYTWFAKSTSTRFILFVSSKIQNKQSNQINVSILPPASP